MVFAARDDAATPFRPEGIAETGAGRARPGRGPRAARTSAWEPLRAEEVTERLIAETGGNPLALLELPTELTADQLGGSSPLPAQLHLTDRVEQVFLDRSRRLPADVQACCCSRPPTTPASCVGAPSAAATTSAWTNDALEAAVASGLLVEDGRPCAYATRWCGRRSTRPPRARTGGAPTGRWPTPWPASETPTGRPGIAPPPPTGRTTSWSPPSSCVGSRAQRRGGHASALAAYERAAALTTDAAQRARLMFAAAGSAWACGQAAQSRDAARSGARERHRPAPARATSPGSAATSRSTSARRPRRTGSSSRPHAPSTRSTRPALEMAVAAALIRTYGADSGTPLPRADDLAMSAAGRLAPDAVPQADAGRHDPRRPRATGPAPSTPSTSALRIGRAGGRPRRAREPRQRRAPAGRRRRPAALLRATPCRGPARPGPSRRSSTASSGCASATTWPATRRRAQQRRGGDRARREHRPAGDDRPARSPGSTLLAALQGRDDYDASAAPARGARRDVPPGHPDRPGARPDPLGQGVKAAGAGDNCRRAASPRPVPAPRVRPDVGPRAHRAAVRADETRPGPRLGRRAGGVRRGHRPAVGAGHGRLRAGDDGRPGRGGVAVPGSAGPARAGRSPPRRGAHPAGLRRVAAPQPTPRRRPPAPAPGPGDVPGRARRRPGRPGQPGAARLRRDRPQARPLHPGQADADGAQGRPAGRAPACRTRTSPPRCWVSPRTVAFHLRNVFAKAGVTSRGELAQLDLG